MLTLSNPTYDATAQTISFTATPVDDPGAPPLSTDFTEAVLYVDSAGQTSPSTRFADGAQWRGFSWAAIPSELLVTPSQGATGLKGALFDSDTSAIHFQALWGKKGSCGREDLKTMASYGANIIRLYDYNFARYVQPRADGSLLDINTAGDGHIAFLDEAQARGLKVIIPIPGSNFYDGQYAWSAIDVTVSKIVESVKKNGRIHPAVHSFSVGNELDLPQQTYLISRAIQVVEKIHALAPDYYITIPISNANESKYYGIFKNGGSGISPIPASIYNSRFYNSVQTFKRSDDLERDILKAYDDGGWGVPLVITELGTSKVDVGQSVDQQVAAVTRQASIVRGYMDKNPTSLVKGFSLFQWQNAFYKLNGSNKNTFADAWYGVHSYDGTLCASSTGKFELWNYAASSNQYILFHDDVSYAVDKLTPLTNAAGESLIDKIKPYLQ